MNIEVLKNFCTVVEVKNISKASEIIHITQQALSKQISSLESELNFPLFYRSNKSIRPTPAGEFFYDRIKIEIERFDAIVKEAQEYVAGSKGSIRIVYTGEFEKRYLVNTITQFNEYYDQVTINIEQELYGKAQLMLRNGLADLIMVPHFENQFPESHFKTIRIPMGHQCVAVSKKSPLAAYDRIPPEELLKQTMILQDFTDVMGIEETILDGVREVLGGTPEKILRTKDTSSMLLMVESNSGFSLARSNFTEEFFEELNNLVIKEIETDKQNYTSFDAVWDITNTNPILKCFTPLL